MKLSLMFSLVAIALVGCSTPYNTVKTGPDRFTVTGTDPNQLQGMAYKACKDDGFDDYSVVDSSKNRMNVRCEKTPPPGTSLLSQANDKAGQAWKYVKQKVDEYGKAAAEKLPEKREEVSVDK